MADLCSMSCVVAPAYCPGMCTLAWLITHKTHGSFPVACAANCNSVRIKPRVKRSLMLLKGINVESTMIIKKGILTDQTNLISQTQLRSLPLGNSTAHVRTKEKPTK